MATTAQRLAQVQAAIDKIETGGQAYTADGRQMSRGDLRTLYDQERRLKAELARETRGGAIGFGVLS